MYIEKKQAGNQKGEGTHANVCNSRMKYENIHGPTHCFLFLGSSISILTRTPVDLLCPIFNLEVFSCIIRFMCPVMHLHICMDQVFSMLSCKTEYMQRKKFNVISIIVKLITTIIYSEILSTPVTLHINLQTTSPVLFYFIFIRLCLPILSLPAVSLYLTNCPNMDGLGHFP